MGRLTTLKPRVQPLKSSRVAEHTGSWRDGKNSAQRGYGYKWQQARAGYLSKHPLCVYCEREGRATPATVVDHIQAHEGDMVLFWDSTNWQSLCATHHSRDKQREEAAAGR